LLVRIWRKGNPYTMSENIKWYKYRKQYGISSKNQNDTLFSHLPFEYIYIYIWRIYIYIYMKDIYIYMKDIYIYMYIYEGYIYIWRKWNQFFKKIGSCYVVQAGLKRDLLVSIYRLLELQMYTTMSIWNCYLKDIYTPMFTTALFTIAMIQNQPKCAL
jgi:hypothetical protein